MKREVKIGIFAVVMLLALWAGIRFLSGIDIFSRNITYYASYENVSGLQTAAPVTIHGVKVGTVESITFDPSKSNDVEVAISVKRQYRLPKDTRAVIYNDGLMGGKAIMLELGSATEVLQRGDKIIAAAGDDMMASIGSELGDLKGKIAVVADNLAKTLENINTLVEQNTDNLSGTMSNLNSISSSLDGVLKTERKNIEGIVTSLNGLAEMLDQNTERFDRIIGNVDAVAEQLEQAKISVKETTPILTIINPVTIPYKKSKPQRATILLAFTFLGAVAGMGLVMVIPTVADIFGNERIRNLVKELPAKEDTDASE